MFTGIVDTVGQVQSMARNNGVELRIKASYKALRKGESIAVNGACLTIERVVKGGFTVHAVTTTLERTLIAEWGEGRPVNLERALRVGDRLGGHFVQGHVDGVATVTERTQQGEWQSIRFRCPVE